MPYFLFIENGSYVRLIFSEEDHFFFPASFMGPGKGTQIDGFKNIGLSLRIISEQKIDPFVKREMQRTVVPEVTAFQFLNKHLSYCYLFFSKYFMSVFHEIFIVFLLLQFLFLHRYRISRRFYKAFVRGASRSRR